MPISEMIRREVMERDGGLCQLFHKKPQEATEISHWVHQGIGGRDPASDVNQPGNLLAACGECHRKLHGPGMPYQIVCLDIAGGVLEVIDPEGRPVPHETLWFYAKAAWGQAESMIQSFSRAVRAYREAAWLAAAGLAWVRDTGTAGAVDSLDYLEIAAHEGVPSPEAKRMVRLAKWREEHPQLALDLVDLDVADRLRKVPEEDLPEVVRWFGELPRAEAIELFNQRYRKGHESSFLIFREGPYRTEKAESVETLEIEPGAVVVKGTVLSGVRQEVGA